MAVLDGFTITTRSRDRTLLRVLRRVYNLSLEAIADAVGVAPVTVERWELGTGKPTDDNARRLERLFHVEADRLLSEPGDATPAVIL
jgi:transcriptional regulator with XRE-family HTH domain